MSVKRLTDKQVECRSYGHQWDPYEVHFGTNAQGVVMEYYAILKCKRCTSERTQVVNSAGEIKRNSYNYNPGYLRRPHEEPFDKHSVRVEFFHRRTGVRTETVK